MTQEYADNIESILNKALEKYNPTVRAIVEYNGIQILVNVGDFKFGYKHANDTNTDHIINHIKGVIADNNGSTSFKK